MPLPAARQAVDECTRPTARPAAAALAASGTGMNGQRRSGNHFDSIFTKDCDITPAAAPDFML